MSSLEDLSSLEILLLSLKVIFLSSIFSSSVLSSSKVGDNSSKFINGTD